MKAATNGPAAFGEHGGEALTSVKTEASRPRKGKLDEDGNLSDKGEEDQDEEESRKSRLNLNKKDEDDEDATKGDFDFDDDDIERGAFVPKIIIKFCDYFSGQSCCLLGKIYVQISILKLNQDFHHEVQDKYHDIRLLFVSGDDWEHEEIFTDDDEAVGNDPEEREELAPEIPAPPEIKQVKFNSVY